MKYLVHFGLFLYILIRYGAHGKFIEGHLTTLENWDFLTRFCFLSERGKLEFEFTYPKQFEPQNILLYYDEADQWPAVYKSDKTCTERESPPHISPENNQKIVLNENHFWSGCSYRDDNVTMFCRASRSFKSARERWWFVAASRCQNITDIRYQGLNLQYRMWLTNGDDLFFKHFSADEFYILQVDIAFLMAQLIMLIASGVIAVQLTEKQLFHSTYKMYIISLSFEVLHLLFMCIAYGNYANNGLEGPLYSLKTFARILESVSLLTFLLMLILMGKGFTITRGRISTSGSIKIAIFMTLYCICYAVLFIYESNFFDPGEVLYLYESPAGYGLIALRILAWVWFCYAVFFTLKHYPEKSSFYFPFLAFYTIWYWAGPIIILVAMKAMNLWVREKIVNGVELTVTFLGHMFFLILTRPSAANKNFPYHVRTSQIGIMQNAPHTDIPQGASKESDSFGTHPYAPTDASYSVSNGAPNFSDLFTVSQTRTSPPTQESRDRMAPDLLNNQTDNNSNSYDSSGYGSTKRHNREVSSPRSNQQPFYHEQVDGDVESNHNNLGFSNPTYSNSDPHTLPKAKLAELFSVQKPENTPPPTPTAPRTPVDTDDDTVHKDDTHHTDRSDSSQSHPPAKVTQPVNTQDSSTDSGTKPPNLRKNDKLTSMFSVGQTRRPSACSVESVESME